MAKWGWVYRDNRVPHYQQVFQRHDGLRQWEKTPKSRFIVPTFYVLHYFTMASALYMTGRLILGHKTWFGKG